MELFWDKGYEGASIGQLKSAMGGLEATSIYAAFGSKERLFFKAVDLYIETIGGRPMLALEAAPSAREGVEGMMREAVAIMSGGNTPPGSLTLLSAINCAPANESVQDHMRIYRTQLPEQIRERLKRGIAEGDMAEKIDIEPLVSLYSSLIQGLALSAHDGAPPGTLLDAVAAAMLAWPPAAPNPGKGGE